MTFTYQMRNKKHSLKQVVSMTCILEGIFPQLLFLMVCESFLLKQSKKTFDVLWSIQVFFAFAEEMTKQILFMRSKVNFLHVDV